MEFNYALHSVSTGKFYTGEAGENWVAFESLDHTPFRYTMDGAYRKAAVLNNGPFAIRDFIVVRVC